MSTMDLELTDLSDLDLDETPPCQVLWFNPFNGSKFECGRPSVARLHMRCNVCGFARTLFLCTGCEIDARRGAVKCIKCFNSGHSHTDCSIRESLCALAR